nr:MAG TPA: hypothetical protein [Caudoviricetes sp.]DAV17215.1 MAG TPA: hypothetical protein [Caudoviricetes sp.]
MRRDIIVNGMFVSQKRIKGNYIFPLHRPSLISEGLFLYHKASYPIVG